MKTAKQLKAQKQSQAFMSESFYRRASRPPTDKPYLVRHGNGKLVSENPVTMEQAVATFGAKIKTKTLVPVKEK